MSHPSEDESPREGSVHSSLAVRLESKASADGTFGVLYAHTYKPALFRASLSAPSSSRAACTIPVISTVAPLRLETFWKHHATATSSERQDQSQDDLYKTNKDWVHNIFFLKSRILLAQYLPLAPLHWCLSFSSFSACPWIQLVPLSFRNDK